MHSDTYNEMMTARAEGPPEPEPTIVVQAQAAEVDSPLICPTLDTFLVDDPSVCEVFEATVAAVGLAPDDITHFQGDDCPGGHYDDPVALLCAPPAPVVDEVTDGATIYVRNGVRIAFPGAHTADEVEEAFRGAGF